MEIIIALFLGGWLAMASILSILQLKKDFSEFLNEEGTKE